MSAKSILSKFAFLSLVLAVSSFAPLRAADVTWQHAPATPADWFDIANWDLNRIPVSGDSVYINNDGTALVASGSANPNCIYLGSTPTTSGHLDLSGGSLFVSQKVIIGSGGSGSFVQTDGTLTANQFTWSGIWIGGSSSASGTGSYQLSGTGQLTGTLVMVGGASGGQGSFLQTGGTLNAGMLGIGYYGGGTGTYQLDSGTIIANQMQLGDPGHGDFIQNGGTVTINSQCISMGGTYHLVGGTINAWDTILSGGTFEQTGGSNIGSIEVRTGGNYRMTGGTLNSPRFLCSGNFDLANTANTVALTGGFLDFSSATFKNYSSANVSVGPNSLMVFPATFDPSLKFASFANAGVTAFSGSTIVIPAGKTVIGNGEINDHLDCHGAMQAPSYFNLNKGLTLADSGYIDLGTGQLYVNNDATHGASSVNSGTLKCSWLRVSTWGAFEHTGGEINLSQNLLVCGYNSDNSASYHMSGGAKLSAMDIRFWDSGYKGSGSFVQDSGDVSAEAIEFDTNLNSSWTINAGTLAVKSLNIGHFTQKGGAVTINGIGPTYGTSYIASDGALHDGLLTCNNTRFSSNNFTQYGGTIQFVGSDSQLDSHNFTLQGGQIFGQREIIGYLTTATFTHSGGVNTVAQLLRLGDEVQGTYQMAPGATLSAPTEEIGCDGPGHFIQTGGSHAVAGDVVLSTSPDSGDAAAGVYDLSGGTLSCNNLKVGVRGSGTFNHSAGSVTVTDTLGLATKSASSGAYKLSGTGQLSATKAIIGDLLAGTFTQTGGTASFGNLYVGNQKGSVGSYIHNAGANTVTGNIYLGYGSNSQGTYQLDSAATLNATNIYVGYNSSGAGTFINNGGTYHGNLVMGRNSTYTQGAGAITGAILSIGSNGDSTFNLTGGTGDFTTLNVGCNSTGTGHVNLSGFGLISADIATIGAGGPGFLNQNCGMLTIRNNLVIGGTSGGQLIAGAALIHSGIVVIGQVNQGLFSTDAGELQTAVLSMGEQPGSLGIMNITDTWVRAGTFLVGGNGQAAVNIMSSSTNMEVSSKLAFGSQSTFTAVPGSSIHMTGAAFENKNTDPTKLAGLANTTLLYDGHTGATDPFEIAGKDIGRDLDGLVSNFALGGMTLEDKAVVQLVDNFDNAHRNGLGGSAEALYMESLTMLPGSTLDLNGKHLYVCDLNFQGGTIISGTGGALISLCPGDADNNWKIDGADLALWQQNYDPSGAHSATNTFAMGDWNNDGKIDGADLALWQQNYNPSGGLPQQTPEPGTLLLLGTGALSLAAFARRRLMH